MHACLLDSIILSAHAWFKIGQKWFYICFCVFRLVLGFFCKCVFRDCGIQTKVEWGLVDPLFNVFGLPDRATISLLLFQNFCGDNGFLDFMKRWSLQKEAEVRQLTCVWKKLKMAAKPSKGELGPFYACMLNLFSFFILISSFGSAITFPHFSHLDTCNGSYMGIKNFDFKLWTI